MQIIDQNETQQFIMADKGTRFGNNIIDTIVFYFLIFLSAMLFDEVLGIVPEGGSGWFLIYFVFLYIIFHTGFEHFFSKTPGKFLTKTTVVNKDGNKPTFSNLLGRNAARLIPFDGLSFLISERGWHDQLSNTYVIKDIKQQE